MIFDGIENRSINNPISTIFSLRNMYFISTIKRYVVRRTADAGGDDSRPLMRQPVMKAIEK